MSSALALGAPSLGPVPLGHPGLEPRIAPRLRALLSAARGEGNAVLLLPPLEQAALARLLRALAEAYAAEHRGQILLGAAGAVLLLGSLAGLRGVSEAAAVLAPGLVLPLFPLPAAAAELISAATPWFSGAPPQSKRVMHPQPMRREAVVILARGAQPRLAGWYGPPGKDPDDPLHWRDLRPGEVPAEGFGGTILASAALLAEPALLAAWRAGGGRLAVGPIGAPLAGWLRLSAIPADLLLLRWSAELPAALAPALRDPLLPGRLVLTGADTPAALAWGLRQGVSRYAGTVVEALLAATRLGACPAGAGCTARACAARAASPADPIGCGNPALLRRWLP